MCGLVLLCCRVVLAFCSSLLEFQLRTYLRDYFIFLRLLIHSLPLDDGDRCCQVCACSWQMRRRGLRSSGKHALPDVHQARPARDLFLRQGVLHQGLAHAQAPPHPPHLQRTLYPAPPPPAPSLLPFPPRAPLLVGAGSALLRRRALIIHTPAQRPTSPSPTLPRLLLTVRAAPFPPPSPPHTTHNGPRSRARAALCSRRLRAKTRAVCGVPVHRATAARRGVAHAHRAEPHPEARLCRDRYAPPTTTTAAPMNCHLESVSPALRSEEKVLSTRPFPGHRRA
jgi:hypothetical protein